MLAGWPMFSETISRFLIRYAGHSVYFGITVTLLLATPLALLWLVIGPLISGRRRGSRYGLGVGVAVAIWASLCGLCVPYIGVYPNLIGGALGLLAAGRGADDTLVGQLCIHGTNAALWPLLGWLVFRSRQTRNEPSLASN